MKNTIELLAPAGYKESLVAAVESGCDAVYLGVEGFNARNRAKNFKIDELNSIIYNCHKKDVKVYLTLNTLIKNNELGELTKLLYKVASTKLDAIIFQDWSIYYLAQKLGLKHLHTSTQAGFHNSIGVQFCSNKGIDRTILARELTLNEIEASAKAGEVEVFVHGALCYSLSGNCLFSSYLGGMSANRGKCKQPCRRVFNITKRKKEHLFSLRDFELIEYIDKLKEIGVASIKIEGRMKRAEYVAKVVSAYRMVLDDSSRLPQAKLMLENDYGRSKTAYFAGGNVSQSISENPFAGIYIGKGEVNDNSITMILENNIAVGDKIKIYIGEEDSSTYPITKIDVVSPDSNESVEIGAKVKIEFNGSVKREQGIQVYKVSGTEQTSYKLSLQTKQLPNIPSTDLKKLLNIPKKSAKKQELYVRVNSLEQISLIPKIKEDFVYIISIDNDITPNKLGRFKNKLFIELPDFISEEDIVLYREKVKLFLNKGITNFSISHISQLQLLSKSCNVLANEKVYSMNDLAIKQLKEFGVKNFIYPYENDYPNLQHYNNKEGIVPMYYTPALFTSRMPVKERVIKDRQNQYLIKRVGKLTKTYPLKAVAIYNFKSKLRDFKKFFIDISTPNIDDSNITNIFNDYSNGKNIEGSSKFNVKKGLW